jgi:hypothetical protein
LQPRGWIIPSAAVVLVVRHFHPNLGTFQKRRWLRSLQDLLRQLVLSLQRFLSQPLLLQLASARHSKKKHRDLIKRHLI